MDTVTYSDAQAQSFLRDSLIPIRVNTSAAPEWARDYVIQYTPTLIIADENGAEHWRNVGFLSPADFIPAVMTGIVKTFVEKGKHGPARKFLEAVVKKYPGSKAAAQATAILNRNR